MTNKNIWLLVVLLLILMTLVVLVGRHFRQAALTSSVSSPNSAAASAVVSSPAGESATVVATDTAQLRTPVPVGIKVPTVGEVIPVAQQKEIAVPTIVIPAAPGAVSSARAFNISGVGGKFVPAQVIVKQGDTVRINLTAEDGNYDFILKGYNMRQSATKGQTKTLEFQALAPGSFMYYCQSCGGATTAATGSVIVVP